MKIKIIFSIIMITQLCMGKIYAQNATQILSGTKAGNYEATSSIQSTQVLSKGATTYVAGNQIVLKPGFHAKAESELTAKIDNPSNYLTIVTYNVENNGNLPKSAEVIKTCEADIVAIQELVTIEEVIPTHLEKVKDWLTPKFISKLEKKIVEKVVTVNGLKILKEKTGLSGEMCEAFEFPGNVIGIPGANVKIGIALLWNEKKLGSLIGSIKTHVIRTPEDDDFCRVYLVAEFADVAIIAAHLPTNANENKKVLETILKENIITSGKTVIIAGDLNPRPKADDPQRADGYETKKHLQANGWEILNVMYDKQLGDKDSPYARKHYDLHATSGQNPPGGHPDLILWKNPKPNSRVIWRGVPECLWAKDDESNYPGGQYKSWRLNISDHLPYLVKIKIK